MRYIQQLLVGSALADQASNRCTLDVFRPRHFVNIKSNYEDELYSKILDLNMIYSVLVDSIFRVKIWL
jgi:hypothetical protein